MFENIQLGGKKACFEKVLPARAKKQIIRQICEIRGLSSIWGLDRQIQPPTQRDACAGG